MSRCRCSSGIVLLLRIVTLFAILINFVLELHSMVFCESPRKLKAGLVNSKKSYSERWSSTQRSSSLCLGGKKRFIYLKSLSRRESLVCACWSIGFLLDARAFRGPRPQSRKSDCSIPSSLIYGFLVWVVAVWSKATSCFVLRRFINPETCILLWHSTT